MESCGASAAGRINVRSDAPPVENFPINPTKDESRSVLHYTSSVLTYTPDVRLGTLPLHNSKVAH